MLFLLRFPFLIISACFFYFPQARSFTPLDSAPELANFSKVSSLYFLHDSGIRRIFPVWRLDCFEQAPDSSLALSDHPLTWSEVSDLLNYSALELGPSSPLYSKEVREHIDCRKDAGFFSSTYHFEVKKREEASLAALLSFPNAQRCLSVRETHYWLYCYLRTREQALRAGIVDFLHNSTANVYCGVVPVLTPSSASSTLRAPEAPGTASPAESSARTPIINEEDAITRYCKKNRLWPLLDSTHNNIEELLKRSSEIGLDFLSSEEALGEQTLYCLPSQEEVGVRIPELNISDRIWYGDSFDDGKVRELYLAIDTTHMKQESDFIDLFPSQRIKGISTATNQDQEKLAHQDRRYKDDLKITAAMVGGVCMVGAFYFLGNLFAVYAVEEFSKDSLALRSASKEVFVESKNLSYELRLQQAANRFMQDVKSSKQAPKMSKSFYGVKFDSYENGDVITTVVNSTKRLRKGLTALEGGNSLLSITN